MPQTWTEISTYLLEEKLSDKQTILIDNRPIEAYNGWKLQNEKRGGHIPGAVAFPAIWFEMDHWQGIMNAKGIDRDKSLIIYGYDDETNGMMAEKLAGAGYENIHVYNHFADEWADSWNMPMERLARHEQLIYPELLKSMIDNNDGNFLICHAHFGNYEDYEKGHIPGAIALDTLELESPQTWNRRTPEELEEALARHGISHETTVILYGRYSNPDYKEMYPGKNAGHLAAFRCAQILLYAGVEDVRILNGGVMAWLDTGFDLSTQAVNPRAVGSFGKDIPARPELVIDTPEAKELIDSDNGELVSVRSKEEYEGMFSGYNYIEKKGCIPGAVFGNCGSDAYHMENYRNLDYTMRAPKEIENIWAEAGIVPEKHIAFFCGTGWRASEAFFHAWLMGWPRISVYDGGWFEWSSDPDNPIKTAGLPV